MKKMKKMLTAILSTALIFSMGAIPAFATSNDAGASNSNKNLALDGQKISFDKYYISESGEVLPDQTFTFTMTPCEVPQVNEATPKTSDGLPILKGVALGNNGTVTLTFDKNNQEIDNTTKVDKKYAEKLTGTFDLSNVEWTTKPAVYRYTVSEVANDNENITYDTNEFTVDVYVNNEGKVEYALCAEVDETTQQMDTNNKSKKVLEFKNTSSTDTLIIKKEVTGSLADKTKQFNFTILIPEGGDAINLGSDSSFTGTIHRATNSTANDTSVTVTVGTEKTFTLADGEYVTFEGVPKGMIYTVTEDEYDDYTTTIEATASTTEGNASSNDTADVDGNTFNASTENFPIVNGGNTVTFTNDKEVTPTGLALEFGPYLAILGVAVAGAVIVFASRKRRTER